MAKPSTRYRAIRGDGQEAQFLLAERALAYLMDLGGEIIIEEMRRGEDGGWAWTEITRTAHKGARPPKRRKIPLKGENRPESPENGPSVDPAPLVSGPHKTQDLFDPQSELF